MPKRRSAAPTFPLLVLSGAACLLLAAAAASAQVPSASDVVQFNASKRYLRGLVGFAGAISEDELRFLRLTRMHTAENFFIQVLGAPASSSAARAYAACGLALRSSSQLANAIRSAASYADQPVSTMHGDVMRVERLGDLLAGIQKYGC